MTDKNKTDYKKAREEQKQREAEAEKDRHRADPMPVFPYHIPPHWMDK